jgi:hypothetical protein
MVLHTTMASIKYDKKWVEGRGGVIKGNDVYLPSVCKWLTNDRKCSVHESGKPEYCKAWPANVGPQPWLLNMGCKFFDK